MTAVAGLAAGLGPGSRVVLRDLVVRHEDDQVVVGRLATCAFVALPELGGQAVALLQSGLTLGEVETSVGAAAGSPVDLRSFVADLVDVGFVASVDGVVTPEPEPFRSSLSRLRPRHCRWLFGAGAKAVALVLALVTLVALVAQPGLVPTAADFFWSSHPSLVLAGNTALVLVMIAAHELAHLVAARSLDVPGRFSLGTRLNVLVAQTDVTGLWAVEPRRRYRVYLAGIALDAVVLCLAILLQAVLPGPRPVLAALALLQVLGIVSQLQVYLRTDLYFVLANLLRAKNLMEDAAAYALSLAARLVARLLRRDPPEDVLAALPAREARAARIYGVLVTLGSAVALAVFVSTGLPILAGLFGRAVDGVLSDSVVGRIDGLVTLAVEGTLQVVFLVVLVRNRGARLRAVLRRVRPLRTGSSTR